VHPYSVLKLAGEYALAVEKEQRDFYNLLIKNGIPKEDARYYMGIGFATEMYIGCNFRELRHILKQRLDNHAQWEIRQVAQEIYNICYEKFFWLVEDINV
jgi:thymidylate synthase (FAD)